MIRALLRTLSLLVLMAAPVQAQDSLRIAAVINDQIISVYDLEMRLALTIMFSGLPDTNETRQRLAPQVLHTMIDDELKRQEARRQKVPLSEKEVKQTIHRMEKANGLKEGGLDAILEARRIEKSALNRQIESQIYWSKLIGDNFGPQIQISDEEVNAVLSEIERNKGKPEYHVYEIFLPTDKPENDGAILSFANRLIQQLREGAGFEALARNFSKSATADHGGDLGWNAQGQLGPELDNAVASLNPGEVSTPIRTADGYYILHLRDRRTATGLVGGNVPAPTVNVQQFFMPLLKDINPAELAAAMDTTKRMTAKAKDCQELDAAGKKIGSPLSGNLGDMSLDALAPGQRALVRALPLLTPSQPLQTEDGIIVLMVCKREEPTGARLDRASMRSRVENRLVGERLDMAAQQYLKDLRRNAFVDIRI